MAKPKPASEPDDLYERDFYAWTQDQAAKLRARAHNAIDWDNAAEEIESLGSSQKREIRNRLRVLLAHLLKWQYQASRRKVGWRQTIREQRRQIESVLDDSPSLKALPGEILAEVYDKAIEDAVDETRLPSSVFPAACPWTIDEIIDTAFLPGDA
ncbi:DUF29 domain-containing protein [Antarcticirhabdus aurantiaca]|uniref:DUF29 domain-containing protein n=1 Tax=Antarcticirhabdus aurantiaca TaxID=2606717 RepID=A0ACD4NIU2_9HYPH|nr:DUF29 domain-containing protein [Antarcticirhabdus aurantiaca]WAJ26765.1 DUF29 domain-containing protein [Jeongeuplla avenae]